MAILFYFLMGMGRSNNIKCWWECGETGSPMYRWWEYETVQILWKTCWKCFEKLNMKLLYDSVISFWAFSQASGNICLHKNLYIDIPNNLFITKKNWKSPDVFQQVSGSKLWNCYTMEYYSAVKRNNYWDIQQSGWMSSFTLRKEKNP